MVDIEGGESTLFDGIKLVDVRHLIVEVHQQPDKAWSDGAQSLHPPQFEDMVRSLIPIAEAVGRSIMGAGTAVV